MPCRFQRKAGHVVLDQLRTVHTERLVRRLGVLPSEPLTTALATLRKMFAMSCHHGVGMIAFEISIDGQRKCTAGVPDVGVASVIANWVRRASRDPTSGQPIPGRFEEELTLDVGGLSHDPDGGSVHLKWLQQPLKLGQRITLAIVETEEADPPRARDREDPAWAERRKREYYERLKREYGDA